MDLKEAIEAHERGLWGNHSGLHTYNETLACLLAAAKKQLEQAELTTVVPVWNEYQKRLDIAVSALATLRHLEGTGSLNRAAIVADLRSALSAGGFVGEEAKVTEAPWRTARWQGPLTDEIVARIRSEEEAKKPKRASLEELEHRARVCIASEWCQETADILKALREVVIPKLQRVEFGAPCRPLAVSILEALGENPL